MEAKGTKEQESLSEKLYIFVHHPSPLHLHLQISCQTLFFQALPKLWQRQWERIEREAGDHEIQKENEI